MSSLLFKILEKSMECLWSKGYAILLRDQTPFVMHASTTEEQSLLFNYQKLTGWCINNEISAEELDL